MADKKKSIKIKLSEDGVSTKVSGLHIHETLGLLEMAKQSILAELEEERRGQRMGNLISDLME